MAILIDILANGAVDGSGDALAGGSVYVYTVGTTTKTNVYSDNDLTQPVANPITLDAAGKAEVYVNSAVRLVIEDSSGTQVDDIASYGGTATTTTTSTGIVSDQLVPIGTIAAFYDFDGALSFSSDYWAYCDGSSQTIGGITRTLPDLSNRYLIGFGTEGGEDVDSAAWATAAVGNASHTIDISHTHDVGTLQFQTMHSIALVLYGYSTGGGNQAVFTLTSTSLDATPTVYAINNTMTAQNYYTKSGTGSTATGASATQDIQPRSIRVRFIMRIQ